jgi:RNA polymerase sigma-70 factor (ECF subfamily)
MLRISEAGEGSERRLVLEGRLSGPAVEEVRRSCERGLARGERMVIDLSGVAYVDPQGRRLLHSLAARRVALDQASPFVSAQLASDEAAPARASAPASRSEGRGQEEEEELVARLRAGDESAFETLVRREGPRLLAAARRILRDEEDARDSVQEAFLAAHRALASYQGDARVSTWLYRIGINTALMRLRSRRRRREEPIEPLLPRFAADGHHADPVRAWPADAEASLGRRELFALVRQAIDRLPESYRTVLMLRDVEGLDTAEAAQALGLRPEALKMRLHRARQALRTLLDPELSRAGVEPSAPRW